MERIAVAELSQTVLERSAGSAQFIVGLVGPPGVGKSTVADSLAASTGGIVVPMDGFHLEHSVLEAQGTVDRKGAPHTFDAWGFVRSLQRLRDRQPGEVVYLPRFDRELENPIAGAIGVADEPIVVIEGNYLLIDQAPWSIARSIFDLVVYLDLAERTRLLRLLRRHVAHGRPRRAAASFIRTSDSANAALVAATRDRADISVRCT